MAKRLHSVDLTLYGVTKSFSFDPAVAVDGEDEITVGTDLLREVESTNIELVDASIQSARVTVSFVYHYEGELTLDVDVDGSFDNLEDLQAALESGDFSEVSDAVESDINDAFDSYNVEVDIEVEEVFDEDGETIEF